MDQKTFISQNGWFSLTLPTKWEEYDDGEEGTYAFFNTESWTGNFRITPLQLTDASNSNADRVDKYISDELIENKGAVKIRLGNFLCTHYKNELLQDRDSHVIYYWITGMENHIFICSFTIDKKQEETEQTLNEIKTVQNIIKTITLSSPPLSI